MFLPSRDPGGCRGVGERLARAWAQAGGDVLGSGGRTRRMTGCPRRHLDFLKRGARCPRPAHLPSQESLVAGIVCCFQAALFSLRGVGEGLLEAMAAAH